VFVNTFKVAGIFITPPPMELFTCSVDTPKCPSIYELPVVTDPVVLKSAVTTLEEITSII
jgi:hypothetical protein